MSITAPYGSWRSPITVDLVIGKQTRTGYPCLSGSELYWIEGRPLEGGRNVIVRRAADGTIADLTPPGFNVRTLVHEYGGVAYTLAGETVYFVNYADQRLYRQECGGTPEPLTTALPLRYADLIVDRDRQRLIAVCEDHSGSGEAENTLASIRLDNGAITVLMRGRDFVSSPRLSDDGTQLAWLTWDHPNMPWDAAELWVAPVQADGTLGQATQVAGGAGDAAFQPEWGPDNSLYVVLERTGWWNLYRLRDGKAENLWPMAAEFGQPLWVFGMTTYALLDDGRMLCSFCERGDWSLGILDDAELQRLDLPYRAISNVRAAGSTAVFLGGAPDTFGELITLDLTTHVIHRVRDAAGPVIEPGDLSVAETIEFPTTGGLTAFGYFYAPANQLYTAPDGERPPLLVMIHGGPTSQTHPTLDLEIQYWTSRGFAVLDVNYGGSTGFGRAYRERLDDSWGIVDVDDCVNGARFLASQGLVDARRLAITGGSAGGYTTLAALTFRDVFQAGASHFGVGDLEALARDTHKFESRYLDRLIGPYPERRDIYLERSPIQHVGRLECPTIFFQGLEDKVVPPNQAEAMVAALRAKGIPVAYVPFEGEQHGFRKAENIKRAIEGEFFFYAQTFGFIPADPIEPVLIFNQELRATELPNH